MPMERIECLDIERQYKDEFYKTLHHCKMKQALRIQHRLKEFYELVPLSPDSPILFPVSIQAILAMVQEFIDEAMADLKGVGDA